MVRDSDAALTRKGGAVGKASNALNPPVAAEVQIVVGIVRTMAASDNLWQHVLAKRATTFSVRR